MNTTCEECGIVYQHDKPRQVCCVKCNGLLRFKSGLTAVALKSLSDALLGGQRQGITLGLNDALALVSTVVTPDCDPIMGELIDDLWAIGVQYANNKWRVRQEVVISGWGFD